MTTRTTVTLGLTALVFRSLGRTLYSRKYSSTMQKTGPYVFEYSNKDFIQQTAPWGDTLAPQISQFDRELRGRWDQKMEEGVFRYTMDHILTRILPGPKRYIAQLNSKRATERRKPQAIMSINQPFNPDLFNFTKIGDKEILLSLHNTEDETATNGGHVGQEVNGINGLTEKKADRNILIINISPLEYGHVLICPQVDHGFPQVLTEMAVKTALECTLLSQHRGFKLGFNSLCAYASVNHLHFHAYYLEHELMVEYSDVETLGHHVYELQTMPCKGFAFQLHGASVKHVSMLISRIAEYFQNEDIAHSLFITRGTVFGEPSSSTQRTIRLFLWPRQKFVGIKVPDEFNVAVIELGGHLPVKDEAAYHSLTEEVADSIIGEVNLPAEQYNQIKTKVLHIAEQLDQEMTH